MKNAKEELLSVLETVSGVIKCADIRRDIGYWDDADAYVAEGPFTLIEGYTPAEYEAFLQKLDFNYDSGYGMQEVDGTVWLMKDHTWLERGEYDGSEWWAYRECPKVPKTLKREYSQIN